MTVLVSAPAAATARTGRRFSLSALLHRVRREPLAVAPPPSDPELRRERFTLAMIALAAKVMQADSPAPVREEILAFRALFESARGGHEKMVQLFAAACNDERPAAHHAREIVSLFGQDRKLLEDLMERLLRIATADAGLNQAEIRLLKTIGRALGFTKSELQALLGRHTALAQGDPYRVLEISRHASGEEIRRRWRQKVRECHPDLMQGGAAQAGHLALAEARLRAVNAAYDAIQRKGASKKAA